MEPQCKIGGDGMRNREVVNEDRISELPEALLLHILSSLPSETVIATSVLSKRWKSLWKMVPNLKFNSEYHHHAFADNVCNSLILHEAPVLESLHLAVGYKCDPVELGIWIAMAISRKVRKLVLKLELDEEFIFPGIVFRCNNTLEILKLQGLVLFDLTSPHRLNSLKELHLYYVDFKDEETVYKLLCGCPLLQELVLHQVDISLLDTFTIVMPSLQRLTLSMNHYRYNGKGCVINAPSLKYLKIDLFESLECCLIENAPELVEAKISDVSDIMNENILESLISAKRLSFCLSPSKIKFPVGKIFHQLLSLELFTDNEEWWNLLSLMLDSSPKLQILKLIDLSHIYYNKVLPIGPRWNYPKCVPECLLFHLETFVWRRYKWDREDEKAVATYILKNARRLKKATLSTKYIDPADRKRIAKRREMLIQLGNEVGASNSYHLMFKYDTYSDMDHYSQRDADFNW